jgi:hypothetical protein
MEAASLEEVGFCFITSARVDVGGANLNANNIPFLKCDKKIMYRAQPRKDHDSRWLFGKNLRTIMLLVRDIVGHEYG